jgi:DivIVA domain-containing protein
MPAVDFDRQAIERRDFPVSRRGYDPAAVDAHLRALAAEFDELQRAASGGEVSLASTASSQVQNIIEAAETAAAEIERQALEHARSAREAADQDAQRTRSEAIERSRAHVAAVAEGTAVLLERVQSMDGEVAAQLESIRAGAGRLAVELSSLEGEMGALYDAAAGRGAPPSGVPPPPASPARAEEPALTTTSPQPAQPPPRAAAPAPAPPPARARPTLPIAAPPAAPQPAATVPGGAASGDLDGARLIALNMALNGESRSEAERYLAEHFESIDRLKLIDEVYAAIEG